MSLKHHVFRTASRIALAHPAVDLIGRRRRGGVDAALDPQIAAVVELQRMLRLPSLDSMEPARARRFAEDGLSPLDAARVAMAHVIDTTVPGPVGPIPVRIYEPPNASPHWLVYFHGGGGVIGSIDASDPVARVIAAESRCTVASVGYRLGPEHRHPAALDDAIAAFRALRERAPVGARVGVGGDSFGGFLSAHVDHAANADLQVLIYPIVDYTMTSPSIDRYADGYLLTRPILHWFREHYLRPTDDVRALSPQFWPDHRGAPAIVVTAGYDPLVDEGDAYVTLLERAGVRVRHRRYAGLVHGFVSLCGGVHAARAAIVEVCADIREMLA